MNRRAFVTALAAVPFAAKPVAALLAHATPQPPDELAALAEALGGPQHVKYIFDARLGEWCADRTFAPAWLEDVRATMVLSRPATKADLRVMNAWAATYHRPRRRGKR